MAIPVTTLGTTQGFSVCRRSNKTSKGAWFRSKRYWGRIIVANEFVVYKSFESAAANTRITNTWRLWNRVQTQ